MAFRDHFDARRSFDFARGLYPHTLRLFEQHFDWQITGRWMLLSAAVGVLGAIGALIFSEMVQTLSGFFLLDLVGYKMPLPGGEGNGDMFFDLQQSLHPARRWLLFIIPALGGLLSGWIVFTFAPEAEGHGTDAVIRAFHREQGVIRPRVPLVKAIASAITIGTGGSAGREGPIAQIGAALGSLLATRLRLSVRERRILLIAGIAAGVGSIFRSPLGGAFFAVEVLYRQDLETEGLMPSVVAAITGYSIFSSIEGSATVFATPNFAFVNPLELIPLVAFALLCAAVGILYVEIFYGTKRVLFDRMPLPPHVKPAIGGLLVGAIAFWFPAVLGSSYGWLQQAMYGNLPITVMALLALAKIVATSFTIGSGGSGGVFAPSLVIGGMLGGLFGEGLHALLPELVAQPEAYVMLGMATFFAGVANVPISTTIMISEMTGSYRLLVPLIFAAVIVHLLIRNRSLYTQQVRTHADSPAHQPDVLPHLLDSIRVRQVITYPVPFHELPPDATLDEILSVFTRTREVILPVRALHPERDGPYGGLVLLDDVQSLLKTEDLLRHGIIAADIQVPFAAVHLDDSLTRVMEAFDRTGYPELPVLDDQGRIVGFIRQGQLITEYYRAYLRQERETPAAS
ncbi:MAG: chloride channel protein [Rhodothermaceae bacterium]|nr:MAG: chloride channel protein [Rhodothermaceae bacterium]